MHVQRRMMNGTHKERSFPCHPSDLKHFEWAINIEIVHERPLTQLNSRRVLNQSHVIAERTQHMGVAAGLDDISTIF